MAMADERTEDSEAVLTAWREAVAVGPDRVESVFAAWAERLTRTGNDAVLAELRGQYALWLRRNRRYEDGVAQLRQAGEVLSQSRMAELLPEFLGAELRRERRETYCRQCQAVVAHGYQGRIPAWEDLALELVPCTDGGTDYWLFDRERGWLDPASAGKKIFYSGDLFADDLMATVWNWKLFALMIAERQTRGARSYVLIEEPERFWALLQIPHDESWLDAAILLDGEEELRQRLTSAGDYLPWHVVADDGEASRRLYQIMLELHRQRLTTAGRHGDRVLLTIAIPSFNRGVRALESVRECLKTHFDEEIEILVSDNASTKGEPEYRRIAALNDARVRYHRNERNLQYVGNLLKVLELARGRFVMMVSDEDQVNVPKLEELLNKLRGQEARLAWLRTSTSEKKFPAEYHSAGAEAITRGILRNNYLSGIVYNTAMAAQSGAAEYLRAHADNEICTVYPHMVIDLLMTPLGAVAFSPLVTSLNGVEEGDVDNAELLRWQSPEGRLKQHRALVEIFLDVIRQRKLSAEVARTMLLRLVTRTADILYMNIKRDSRYQFDRVYFDALTALERQVTDHDLPAYREQLGVDWPEEEKDRIRAVLVSGMKRITLPDRET